MTTSQLHTDQYLIDGLAENNSQIIRDIYKKYSPKMYQWLQQHNAEYEQAQDIFQEAMIDIYRKSSSKRMELTCPFDAFLFAIVRNKWYNFIRNNKMTQVTEIENLPYSTSGTTNPDAESVMQYENQHKLLITKLEELQEGCKEILKFSWSGLGMEEVARKLEMTYAYVRKKKSLCMAKLIESIKSSSQFQTLSFIKS